MSKNVLLYFKDESGTELKGVLFSAYDSQSKYIDDSMALYNQLSKITTEKELLNEVPGFNHKMEVLMVTPTEGKAGATFDLQFEVGSLGLQLRDLAAVGSRRIVVIDPVMAQAANAFDARSGAHRVVNVASWAGFALRRRVALVEARLQHRPSQASFFTPHSAFNAAAPAANPSGVAAVALSPAPISGSNDPGASTALLSPLPTPPRPWQWPPKQSSEALAAAARAFCRRVIAGGTSGGKSSPSDSGRSSSSRDGYTA